MKIKITMLDIISLKYIYKVELYNSIISKINIFTKIHLR